MQVNAAPAPTSEHYILAPSDLPSERDFVLKHDDTFALFDRFGDLDAGANSGEGLYHKGTRFLSLFRLKVANGRPLLLSSTVRRDNVLMSVDLTNPDVYFDKRIFLQRGVLHIYRSQFLWRQKLHHRINLRNFSRTDTEIGVTIEFGADFADIFEVRGSSRAAKGRVLDPIVEDGAVTLSYLGLDRVTRTTTIRAAEPPQVTFPGSMHFTIPLAPDQERDLELIVECRIADDALPRINYFEGLKEATCAAENSDQLTCDATTSDALFNAFFERSRVDLNMLLTAEPQGPYPFAGIPWFATPFGRDGIITALECLWASPGIARGVLGFLSATQAQKISPEQDAEPGKILHEAREGEMAALGEVPFRRYYGSVDATPLYLILAGEYYRRTGDLPFLRSIWPHLVLAVDWIDRYGDSDGDGFVEYSRQSKHGLVQQGWKDSGDSIFHADGELAEPPIALCEVQGYVYRGKLEVAALAAALGFHNVAERLSREAQTLRRKFEAAFWCEDLRLYAIALDGHKRKCAVRASNAGHALFSGIAAPERAASVADELVSEKFYSGWGIRTIADSEPRYNPMAYHNGSVWPHDNALIADGFARYGLTRLAAKILADLFEVSNYLDFHRLPELFCGFPRRHLKGPTSYPVACSPQAWSAASAFLLLQSAMGLRVDALENRITLASPMLPHFLHQVNIRGLKTASGCVDLRLFRSGDAVAVAVENRSGDIQVLVSH